MQYRTPRDVEFKSRQQKLRQLKHADDIYEHLGINSDDSDPEARAMGLTDQINSARNGPTKTAQLYEQIVKQNKHSVSSDPSYYDKYGKNSDDENAFTLSMSHSAKINIKTQGEKLAQSKFARFLDLDNDSDIMEPSGLVSEAS